MKKSLSGRGVSPKAQFRIPKKLKREVEKVARRLRVPVSVIYRRALEHGMETVGWPVS